MAKSEAFTAFASVYQKNRLDAIKQDTLDVYIASKSRNHNPIKMEIMINTIAREHLAGKTQKEIAQIVNLSTSGVQYHLNRINSKGFKRKGNTRFKGYALMKLKEYMFELKQDGKKHSEIAKIVGLQRSTVTQHLKNYNL